MQFYLQWDAKDVNRVMARVSFRILSVHSINIYILNTCYVLGTELSAEETVMNKADTVSALTRLMIYEK